MITEYRNQPVVIRVFNTVTLHCGPLEMNTHDGTTFSCKCITVPENHRAAFDFGHLFINVISIKF